MILQGVVVRLLVRSCKSSKLLKFWALSKVRLRFVASNFDLSDSESCGANSKIPISDTNIFEPCQITASSEYDKARYPVKKALNAAYNTGWRSNTWLGQWARGQYIKLALLRSYKISRIIFHKESSFGSFYLQYSNDPEGIYWKDYVEQNSVRRVSLKSSLVEKERICTSELLVMVRKGLILKSLSR